MTKDNSADAAMKQIWSEWFSFYQAHFRGQNVAISAADQMAFYEIAQPILRSLSATPASPAMEEAMTDWSYNVQALEGAAEFFDNMATGENSAPLAFAQAIRAVLPLAKAEEWVDAEMNRNMTKEEADEHAAGAERIRQIIEAVTASQPQNLGEVKVTDDQVEATAKFLFTTYNPRLKGSYGMGWSDIGGPIKARWRDEARAALTAAISLAASPRGDR